MVTPWREPLRRSWRSWLSNDLAPQGPAWLQWLWTLLFGVAIALLFTLIGMASHAAGGGSNWREPLMWWRVYRINLVVSLTIAATIHLLFWVVIPLVGAARIRRFTLRQRGLFFTAVPVAGLTIGWPLGVWLVGPSVAGWIRLSGLTNVVGMAALALIFSYALFLFFSAKAQQAEAEKRAAEAQLRLLQGQMEPHFLFNTLANVLTLIDTDAARAKQMLESFTDYLRSSLTSLRHDDSTLARELDLAAAYLALLQLRMDERLRYEIAADDSARSASLPPLLLQPLVENAIQHGLEPKVDGGRVRIAARVDGDTLTLTVADDGLGPDAPKRPHGVRGNGVALDNLRQRLRARYGDHAALRIEARHPGTAVTVTLPFVPSMPIDPTDRSRPCPSP